MATAIEALERLVDTLSAEYGLTPDQVLAIVRAVCAVASVVCPLVPPAE